MRTMNILHLCCLCQLISLVQTVDPTFEPLDSLKLAIVENGKKITDVHLTQAKRTLANEHLPVWILNGVVDAESIDYTNGKELHRNYEVMKKLGKFTVYQQRETSTSAIFFHKRREFDGMINHEFLIRELPIDKLHPTKKTVLTLNDFGVYRRQRLKTHKRNRKMKDGDRESGVSYQGYKKTYKSHLYDGYVEVLVVVSWDLAEVLTVNLPKSDWYPKIVSHVLTLFNGVDMLYSKLKYTNIQVNIAGVIIGTAPESFRFIKSCYRREKIDDSEFTYRLDGGCVTIVVRRYLNTRGDVIPLESYDVAIFLTSEQQYLLMEQANDSQPRKFQKIVGTAGSEDNSYEIQARFEPPIHVATVTTDGHFKEYPGIAHEMAHLMTVKHDIPLFFTPDGECCGSLMKTSGIWCDKCLSWSEISEKSFYFFFSSPNCCAFINPPRSLNPPGRYRILSDDIQCRCYGYESAEKISNFRNLFQSFCDVKLRCGAGNDYRPTALPMDGTPCGDRKVCWQERCEAIEVFPQPQQKDKTTSWLSPFWF